MGEVAIGQDLDRQQAVLEILKGLQGLEPLKELFWSELSYQRVNQPLSRRGWNQTAANALNEDPVLFAGGGQNNDFHVVYSRLPQPQLRLGQERPVVSQLLKEHPYGLFIFSNQTQDHWHFINVKYDAEMEKRRLFRRISISQEERLRTAAERVAMLDLQAIQPDMFGLPPLTIQSKHDEAFDVEAVTKQFFEEYKAIFRILEDDLKKGAKDHSWAHDYSLQFLNRCMFIYFIQRKGWLGKDTEFLRTFWQSYQKANQPADSFVENWLKVLFFEAFNNRFHGGYRHFPKGINDILSLAPYLNGGLFAQNKTDTGDTVKISDRRFEQIFKIFERYNFTIAEDSPLDKEVAVDPEMIGKVYESLVNVSEEVDERGEAGIFYTPRTEIDLMCRLSLVDHLANHLGENRKELLYQLVFALEPDEKVDADRAVASAGLWPALNERLHDIAVLDLACGSGSFLVGMLNILDDLQERAPQQLGVKEDSFTRKKRIIGQSLYGVDVMEWACHVAELRLWLALIIDAEIPPAELHVRKEPLLPHFTFKIRCGDSLVQEVGGINLGHIAASQEIPPPLKARITTLKNEKLEFYNNDTTCQFHSVDALKNEEKRLFSDILDAREHVIQERIKALRRKLEGPQTYQIGLDGKGAARPHQMDMEANKYRQEIESLTAELAQTESSQKVLSSSKEVPFVWDIAFVEIFESEKDGFDIVIGNPPYVNYKAIYNPNIDHALTTPDNVRSYKANLVKSVYSAFPQFFGYKASSNSVARKFDARSDLYIYFYFHGLSLLNARGSFCFITSNSWLDVDFGITLQEFLIKHSHIKMVIDNEKKRTFAQADVNSVIALFSPPDDRREWALEKTARFVMFRVPFEHILDPIIFDEIEEANERKATKEYRVFPIQQGKLLEDGCEIPEEEETGKAAGPLIKTARYIGNKWGGKYLRAPDIFWTILDKGKNVLLPLGTIVHITTGVKEGGYSEYIFPRYKANLPSPTLRTPFILKDTSQHTNIRIETADSVVIGGSDTVVQKCSMLKCPILWLAGRGHTHKTHLNPHLYPFSGNYIGVEPNDKNQVEILVLLLNSTLVIFVSEVLGRSKGIGGGACVFTKSDLEKILILDPNKLGSKEKEIMLDISRQMGTRDFTPIFEEFGLPTPNEDYSNISPKDISLDRILTDRRELDKVVFQAIGLTETEQLGVYMAVVELVKNRFVKAKSLGKAK